MRAQGAVPGSEVTKFSTNRPAPAEVITMARYRDEDFHYDTCGGSEALAGFRWSDRGPAIGGPTLDRLGTFRSQTATVSSSSSCCF
jgi:hypothetical protein